MCNRRISLEEIGNCVRNSLIALRVSGAAPAPDYACFEIGSWQGAHATRDPNYLQCLHYALMFNMNGIGLHLNLLEFQQIMFIANHFSKII